MPTPVDEVSALVAIVGIVGLILYGVFFGKPKQEKTPVLPREKT